MILHSFVGLFMQDQCPNSCVILLEISFMITHDSHIRSYMIMHELEESHRIIVLGSCRTSRDHNMIIYVLASFCMLLQDISCKIV